MRSACCKDEVCPTAGRTNGSEAAILVSDGRRSFGTCSLKKLEARSKTQKTLRRIAQVSFVETPLRVGRTLRMGSAALDPQL